MRIDLHSIDPWASGRARRRDWCAAVLGALLLVTGALMLVQKVVPRPAPASAAPEAASVASVDSVEWQGLVQRSRALNRTMADLSHPWSRWLERTLLLAGGETRLERLEGDPLSGKLEVVFTVADLTAAGELVRGFAGLPGARRAHLLSHEPVAEGLRVRAEVVLK